MGVAADGANTDQPHSTIKKTVRRNSQQILLKNGIKARKPASAPDTGNCNDKWGSLPNDYFQEKVICAVDVLKAYVEGFKVPVEEGFIRLPNRNFFLIAPGVAPIELLGDANRQRGSICSDDSPNGKVPVARFQERRKDRLKTLPIFPFIIHGQKTDVESLALDYEPLIAARDSSCEHPTKGKLSGSNFRVLQSSTAGTTADAGSKSVAGGNKLPAKNQPLIFYIADFSKSGEGCERLEWGTLKDKKCRPLGSQISDCPDDGPKTDRGAGKPKGIFTLKTPKGSYRFLLQDATFWDYYGHTILPINADGIPDVDRSEPAFEDPCLSR